MLTDYHTHLRPDVPDTPPERFFTEDNVRRYIDAAAARGIAELGFSEHVYRFRESLDVWEHEFWRACAFDSLDDYVEFLARMPVKVGLEVDWIPGREEQIAQLIGDRPWDYIIGAVHFIGDRLAGRLVIEARIALGDRSARAPDLDQVGVGEDVE